MIAPAQPAAALLLAVCAAACSRAEQKPPPNTKTAYAADAATRTDRQLAPVGSKDDASAETLDDLVRGPSGPEPPIAEPIQASGVRELHPLNPGDDSCIEMYSVCFGTPERCTSGSLFLKCGERGSVPRSIETLLCVCP